MIEQFDAYLFDLDGVITPTVLLHRRAWQETFDLVFAQQGVAPYRQSDYFDSLDGRPRFDGVRTLLAARGIELPDGDEADGDKAEAAGVLNDNAPLLNTVHEIGNHKNRTFTNVLERVGIEAYPGSLRLIERLEKLGKPLAIVSSSRNAEPVLRAAGIREKFGIIVDGVVAEREQLPGKPAPDTFLRAAELLGVIPARAVVIEDAASGVAAGSAGAFGLVVGVDRGAGAEALSEAGAHLVVSDLGELL